MVMTYRAWWGGSDRRLVVVPTQIRAHSPHRTRTPPGVRHFDPPGVRPFDGGEDQPPAWWGLPPRYGVGITTAIRAQPPHPLAAWGASPAPPAPAPGQPSAYGDRPEVDGRAPTTTAQAAPTPQAALPSGRAGYARKPLSADHPLVPLDQPSGSRPHRVYFVPSKPGLNPPHAPPLPPSSVIPMIPMIQPYATAGLSTGLSTSYPQAAARGAFARPGG